MHIPTHLPAIPAAALAVAVLLRSSLCAADSTSFPLTYVETWAGPVQIAEDLTITPNFSSGFDLVEATLVMPALALPANPREQVDQYTVAFWLGMDGVVSDPVDEFAVRGLWQAGVVMSRWTNGTVEYRPFYEWIPEDPVFLSPAELSVSEGDHLYVTIGTSAAGFRGTTTLTNRNTTQSFGIARDAPQGPRRPTWRSPGSSAQWIMEAGTYVNGPRYVLPDWCTASFLDARACYSSGRCIGAGDANPNPANTMMYAIRQEATQIVNTRSYARGEQVSIAYVEEPLTGY